MGEKDLTRKTLVWLRKESIWLTSILRRTVVIRHLRQWKRTSVS